MKKKLVSRYIDSDTHFLEFQLDTKESVIYKYAYKYALTHSLKVGNLIYDRDDNVQRISLTPFYS